VRSLIKIINNLDLFRAWTENPRVGGSIPSLATILSCVGKLTWSGDMAGRKRRKPRCIIIAGPNGAGKTTFARKYLPNVGLFD
jgi:hypothetical protein